MTHTKECTECRGAGWIYINTTNKYHEKIVRRLKCKVCDGDGYIKEIRTMKAIIGKPIIEDSDDSYDGIDISDYNDGDIMLIQNGEAIIIQDEHISLVITALSEALQRRDME